MDPGWTLHLGDCLDPVTGLASLADKSVDHVITDPPYAAHIYERARLVKSTKNDVPALERLGALDIGVMSEADAGRVVEQLRRAANRWILAFHDAESWHWYIRALGDAYVRAGVWVKPDALPQFSGDRPAQGFEAITIGHRPGKKRWNGGGRPAAWTVGFERERDGGHPCPKPIRLMETLVRDFTDPGELVCDPFAGSGTTGVACLRLGRRFVGWERDPKYHAVAVKRLTAAREQLRMFEGVA
jgi:site-specific DNA-methyltransferase (adenine-specific)